ncbi:MAG TPA: alpha/beta fold hydrolase [Acidimicrobiales bacterium]|nr:alpha/beta fold hydrolase [Acidimicrobiales bacterium]
MAGRLLGRVDRLGLADSLIRVAAKTSTTALPRRMAGLGLEVGKIAVGKSTVAPEPSDRRFTNRAWTENPAFRRIGQTYLAWSKTTLDLVDDAHLDWRTHERARLAASLLTSTLSPTNLLPLNPDAMVRAYESGGRSIVAGAANIGRDIRNNHGLPRTADPDAFHVGKELAVTPGAVVFRNDVCELLQYAPMTEAVHTTPMVLVPPQINKYYFMDLAPGRSFVEYAVRQGLQMFLVSWRNPTVEHRHWNLDTYVAGVKEALHAVTEITGSPQVNTVALCAGGITTAGLLGHLAATQDSLINAATFAVTLLDFSVPTMIGLFGSQPVIANTLKQARRRGILPAHESAALFCMLRPNDLIWNYWVGSNLLGDRPPAFDVLSWNADPTRLAAGLHTDFLDMFANNSLAEGKFSVLGAPVDLGAVTCDSFVVAARTDHLTDWKACYATTQLLGGSSQFALSRSGHIQSLVNPPGNPKMSVSLGPAPGPDPDQWLAESESVPGSWWEPWAEWARPRSGEERPASPCLGSGRHPAMEPAPGRYVLAA